MKGQNAMLGCLVLTQHVHAPFTVGTGDGHLLLGPLCWVMFGDLGLSGGGRDMVTGDRE